MLQSTIVMYTAHVLLHVFTANALVWRSARGTFAEYGLYLSMHTGIRANAEAGKSGSGIRTTTANAAPSDGVNPELWGLHEELLKEVRQ